MKFIKDNYVMLVIIALLVIAVAIISIYRRSPQFKEISIIPSSSPSPTIPKVEKYEVPILMYHYIRNAENESELGKNLSVSPENFEKQMSWLKSNNYQTMRVAEIIDPERKSLSKIYFDQKKPIILSFDDGYLDAYTQALPILQKYQMTATFYIIRNYLGKDNYMNQVQIEELEKAGFEIGSHTLSHPDLSKLTIEEAQRQIVESKENALTFCYPAGKYNDSTIALVKDAGYQAAVTTHFGIATQDSLILELTRVRVENGSGETLGNKISAAFEQSKR